MREEQGNTTLSWLPVRVAHVFGHQANAMGGKLVRLVGLVRACAKVGNQTFAYNISLFSGRERVMARPA